jgi:hypothetical protein
MKEKEQGQYFKAVANNTVRILPNKKGTENAPYIEFLSHRNVGKQERFVRCGKDFDTRAGKCWLCDVMIPKLAASEKRSKQAMAEAMRIEEDCIIQIGVLDQDSGMWTGPIPWLLTMGGPKSMWAQVMGLLTSPRRSYDSPKKGYNINFTRTGTGMNTKYGTLEPDDEPSAADPTLLKKLKPLEDLVPKYTEAEQKEAFYNTGDDKNKKTRDEEDEEPEEDETETEETEEEEAEAEEEGEEEEAEEEDSDVSEDAEEVEEEEEAEEEEAEEEEAEEEESEAEEEEEEVADEDVEEMPDEEELEEALDAEEAEEEEELAEEEEEEAPPPPKKTVPAKKPVPPAKKAAPLPAKKAAAPAAPAKKAAPPPAPAKKPVPPVKKGAAPVKKAAPPAKKK